jgi:TfoX/Sxy family transcriptional regulator of competence genes
MSHMAYDEGLVARVRDLIGEEGGVVEKRMFGGLAILLEGNMAVGMRDDTLIVRADPEEYEALLAEPGAGPFRGMRGWLVVDPSGYAEDEDLRRWIGRGVGYARSLPPK